MRLTEAARKLARELIRRRLLLSLGLSAASGIVLHTFLYPINEPDPILRLIAFERPSIYVGLVWSYTLFLYSTPFLVSSILSSLAYVHFYSPEPTVVAPLPDKRRS